MNIEAFRLINNLANKNKILDWIMIFFSKDVMYMFMIVIVIIFLLGIKKNNLEYRKIVISTLLITIISLMLNYAIGWIYYEDRPFVYNNVNLLYPHLENASFPSKHAIGTMSIALGLRKYNKSAGRILMILSIIVGLSRVYVGHHYPLDVIGAYIIAFGVNYSYNLKLRIRVENLYEIIEKSVKGLSTRNTYRKTNI